MESFVSHFVLELKTFRGSFVLLRCHPKISCQRHRCNLLELFQLARIQCASPMLNIELLRAISPRLCQAPCPRLQKQMGAGKKSLHEVGDTPAPPTRKRYVPILPATDPKSQSNLAEKKTDGSTREQKRHIKLLHIKLFPVAPVTGPPGRVSGQKDLCSLGSEDST